MKINQELYKVFKRLSDLLLSLIGLIVLFPVFVVIGIIIKVDSKGPIFFKQKRFGKNEDFFNIYKFRTMRTDAPSDAPTDQLEDPKIWITKSGSILRKTSLDELPQLLNIIKGEMSIVGPRPALWNQTQLIHYRGLVGANELRPGLTGWAQINGRDELDDFTKAEYDGYYVNHMGLILDVRCVFSTAYSVISKKDIVEGKRDTEEKNLKEEINNEAKY